MALLAVALVPIAWYFHRSLVDFPRTQRWVSLGVRSVIVLLLVLAATGLNLVRGDDRQYVVFLVDRSDSVDVQAAGKADAFVQAAIKGKRATDEARVIDFAGTTVPPRMPGTPGTSREALDRSRTDIGSAISAGWASVPAFYAKTLVLLSDGRPTQGDALRSVQAAHRAGVRVCTVPLESTRDDEVQLTQVGAPAQVRSGSPFALQVEISANHDDTAELEIFRNDIRIGSESVRLKQGVTRLTYRQVASTDRFQTYTVRLKAGKDHFLDNNVGSALVACEGKPRVLLVEATPRDARYLTWALEKEDIEVDVRGPRGVPRTLADIENFELICLSNVPATDLDKRQMQLIRSYVQDLGGGLIMIGGDQSFGLGGYYKTVLEEILPVHSDFEKDKEKPSLAMVLVIDKSGSMGGQKIELAKDAAKAAAELLSNRDQVGVLAFDGAPKWVCEIHSASDRDFVMERIGSLDAGGGTDMAPALSQAYTALEGVQAKLKHVIALTDGISQPGNFYEVVSAMSASQITVSTVAIGAEADRQLLERIAEWGHGRTYFTDDPGHIPQIFARETMEASKSAINEQPFLPIQVRPHQICQGIRFEESPFLLGYVITRAKETAEQVLATEAGHPLLVTWRYGLGKSLAFTSDAKNRWAAEWLQWPGFSRFWSQTIRDTMRTTTHASMHIEMTRSGKNVAVTVDALHPSPQRAGEYLDDVQTIAELIRPGAGKEEVRLNQTSPGRYVGSFETPESGSYHVRIVQKQKDVELQSVSRGVAIGYSDEYRVGQTDTAMLRRLAEVGGGTYDVGPGKVFTPVSPSIRVQPLWSSLLAAALILLVLDVAVRRVDFSLVVGGALPWRSATVGR